MSKAVFLHRADSIYDDRPAEQYEFPQRYLKVAEASVGDWIIYYEPVRAGPRGYFAVAKIADVIPKPGAVGLFLALVEPGTFLRFDREIPRLRDGVPWEQLLADEFGEPLRGGLQQSAMRYLPDADFAAIVNAGLPADLEEVEAHRYEVGHEIADPPAIYERPVVERLMRRPYRDVAFRRKVRAAYGERCAISGLGLKNGGGRPEVQAAHIRPVEDGGNDDVRNGIALSGTLHWMFDRGLISVEPESHIILVSHNKVPSDVAARLIVTEQKLRLPRDERDWPHPTNLQWHRENKFGQGLYDLS